MYYKNKKLNKIENLNKERYTMNEVFAIVKIINFQYRFLLNKKNNAICKIEGMLENGSIIKLIAYDNIADWLLIKLKINELYLFQGRLNSNMEIILKEVYKI